MQPKLKTFAFSLVPVGILLLALVLAGRLLYPFEPDKRALIQAERDPRVTLSYFNEGPGAKAILWDINRMERRYLPFLGYLSKPDLTLPTLQTNRLGFRDAPLSPRQPGEMRILLLGGSVAWGIGASGNDKTVRGVLEGLLNKGGTSKYRVMSGAFWGYGARQEMTVLIEFLDTFDPDVVVSLTGHNDVMTMMYDEGGVLERPESKTLTEAVTTQLRPMDTFTALRKVGGSLGVWRLVVYAREQLNLGSAPAGNVPR